MSVSAKRGIKPDPVSSPTSVSAGASGDILVVPKTSKAVLKGPKIDADTAQQLTSPTSTEGVTEETPAATHTNPNAEAVDPAQAEDNAATETTAEKAAESEVKPDEQQKPPLVQYIPRGCSICRGYIDIPEVLLCDGPNCNKEYHKGCLTPPLAKVPEGDFIGPCCSGEDSSVDKKWEWQVGMDAFALTMRSGGSKRYFMCKIIDHNADEKRGRPYKIHFTNTKKSKDEWVDAEHLRPFVKHTVHLQREHEIAQAKWAAKEAAKAKAKAERAAARAAERAKIRAQKKAEREAEKARLKAEKEAIKAAAAAAEKEALQKLTNGKSVAEALKTPQKLVGATASKGKSKSKTTRLRSRRRCAKCGCADGGCGRKNCTASEEEREKWTAANGGKVLRRPGRSTVKTCTRCNVACWHLPGKLTATKKRRESSASTSSSSAESSSESETESEEEEEQELSEAAVMSKFCCAECNETSKPSKMLMCEKEGCEKFHHIVCLKQPPGILPGQKLVGPCCKDTDSEANGAQKPKDICVVIGDYKAEGEGHMSIAGGDAVLIAERRDDGLFRGTLLTASFKVPPTGLFPAAKVKDAPPEIVSELYARALHSKVRAQARRLATTRRKVIRENEKIQKRKEQRLKKKAERKAKQKEREKKKKERERKKKIKAQQKRKLQKKKAAAAKKKRKTSTPKNRSVDHLIVKGDDPFWQLTIQDVATKIGIDELVTNSGMPAAKHRRMTPHKSLASPAFRTIAPGTWKPTMKRRKLVFDEPPKKKSHKTSKTEEAPAQAESASAEVTASKQ